MKKGKLFSSCVGKGIPFTIGKFFAFLFSSSLNSLFFFLSNKLYGEN